MELSGKPFSIMLFRKFNIWYSKSDGNFSDPNTWISNALDKKNVLYPRVGDWVYIDHNVNLDITTSIGNLYVSGKLFSTINGITFSVTGDIQASGTIDFTSNNTNIILYGYNNFITNWTRGNSTVTYFRAGVQNIMPLIYNNLNVYGLATKFLVSDLDVRGNLQVNNFGNDATKMDFGAFNATISGSSSFTFGSGGTSDMFTKNDIGTVIFVGAVTINCNITIGSSVTAVEFRGGVSGGPVGGSIVFNCPVVFSTNSQTSNCNMVINGTTTIKGEITINNTNATNDGLILNGATNGDNVSSTLTNNGKIYLGTTTTPMATGVFNYMTGVSSKLGYWFNGNFTIPYSAYNDLAIRGTGTKTFSANTTIRNFTIGEFVTTGANVDCSTFDITINGTYNLQDLTGSFVKSGSGTIIFVGNASWNGQTLSFASNVTLEFRGGASFGVISGGGIVAGTVNYTTNNQTIIFNTNVVQEFSGTINISSGITLTHTGNNTGVLYSGIITGLSSTSILSHTTGAIIYGNSTAPMATGKLFANGTSNTSIYGLAGNQDIAVPQDATPGYRNLTLQGSGAKKLLGNVSVKGVYTLTAPATLNSNGFALTNP